MIRNFIISFIIGLSINAHSQSELDLLFKKLEKSQSETEKADVLNDISLFVVNSDPEQAYKYAEQALEISVKNNYLKGEGFALYNFGNINYYRDQYEEGLKNLDRAEQIFTKIDDQKGLGYAKNTEAEIYTLQGEYEEALVNLFEALHHFENSKDNVGLARVNNNIGIIQYNQNNLEEALKYFNQALITADEIRTADASLYIGKVYITQNKYSEAERYLEKCLKISLKLEDNYNISDAYFLLGKIDAFYGENGKALKYFEDALKIKEDLEDDQGISLCHIHLGNLFLNQKQPQKSLAHFIKAKDLALALGIREEMKDAYLGLSNTYHILKQYDSAYHYLNENNRIQKELQSEEASKKLVQLESVLATQKREAQIAAERALTEYSKKVMLYSSIGVILVLLIVAAMMYNRYRLKQKANEQLSKYNEEIKQQRDIIEAHNRDIMDSIKYAKRIQEAILPSSDLMDKYIPDYFVLYRPKDIVSGDFYWALPVQENGKDCILFAAVDCTGHGVPGAFVSIVGFNGLNRSVKEFHNTQPAKILDQLTVLVEETFKQKGSNYIKDGMDITLCKLIYHEEHRATLEFAAANNPLWLCKANGEWMEIKADKQPIGNFDDRKPFTNHQIELSKGDTFYIFSDGYADQFGGEKGKKYKYSKFKEFLSNIQSSSIKEQSTILNSEFDSWMGQHEQLDDVCVIGVRI